MNSLRKNEVRQSCRIQKTYFVLQSFSFSPKGFIIKKSEIQSELAKKLMFFSKFQKVLVKVENIYYGPHIFTIVNVKWRPAVTDTV